MQPHLPLLAPLLVMHTRLLYSLLHFCLSHVNTSYLYKQIRNSTPYFIIPGILSVDNKFLWNELNLTELKQIGRKMAFYRSKTKWTKGLNKMPNRVLRLDNWVLERGWKMILHKLKNKMWNNYNTGECCQLWTVVGRIMVPKVIHFLIPGNYEYIILKANCTLQMWLS